MSQQQQEKNEINQIKSDYLIYFQNWLSNSGINPFIARIMQLLRFENRQITQSEMQQALNLSKATISRNLKVMEEMNLLKIDLLSTGDRKGDKYAYELKEQSLFYIFSSFLKNIYDSFKRRKEDNKSVLNKIEGLGGEQKDDNDILNLLRIIKEEELVFDTMIEKFERLIAELDILKYQK